MIRVKQETGQLRFEMKRTISLSDQNKHVLVSSSIRF
jgi:hypothetical protein